MCVPAYAGTTMSLQFISTPSEGTLCEVNQLVIDIVHESSLEPIGNRYRRDVEGGTSCIIGCWHTGKRKKVMILPSTEKYEKRKYPINLFSRRNFAT